MSIGAGIGTVGVTLGRQLQFHVLSKDMQTFLEFVCHRDPVIVTLRDSDSPDIKTVPDPSSETRVMTLWNQSLVSSLLRKRIAYPGRTYYGIDNSLPTLELSPARRCEWNGRDALLPGRIYGVFDNPIPKYEKWFKALARWIQKHFVKSPLPLIGYVGPAAYDWYKKGGVLLPMMISPAVTPTWLSWVEAQDQHRAVFSK